MKWIPRFRFSLRAMMIVTALLAVVFALVGKRVYQARQQQQVVAWVLEHGGTVRFQYEKRYSFLKPPNEPPNEPTTPKWIRSIFGENYFERVVGVEIEDVTDVSPLSELKSLEDLSLSGKRLADLSVLSEVEKLKSVYISGTKISDISALASLKNLQVLFISNTQVSDLIPLAKLKKLEWLCIERAEVSDLSPLTELEDLQYFFITFSKVSEDELAKLKEALPNCTIEHKNNI